MPDFSFLLGAQPIQAPNPLDMAGKALTLGNLANQNAIGQYQVQMQQQMAQAMPEFYAALSQQQGASGSGGQPDMNSILSGIAQKYPLAGQQLTNMVLGMQEKQAQIGSAQATAGEARQKTLDAQLTDIQRLAAGGAPPDVLAKELQRVGANPMNFFDPQNPQTFASNVALRLQDPAVRATIASTQATTARTSLETQQLPAQLAVKQSEAASAATQAQTARLKYLGGDQVEDTNTGDRYQVAPNPADPTRFIATPIFKAGTATPISPATPAASGEAPPAVAAPTPTTAPQPFQPGMPPGIKEMTTANAKTAADMGAQIPAAVEGLNTVNQMRATAASTYSGPVKGSDFFKSIAGVLSQMPGASDAMRDRVSNTQAWEAEGGELAFNMLSSLKGSVPRAQSALNMIRTIKPNTLMTLDAQQQVYDAIAQRFNDQINYAKSAAQAVRGGQTIADIPIPTPSGAGQVQRNPDGSWTLDLTK